MTKEELERLKTLEIRIHEIAKEMGLLTKDIIFEVVPVKRVIEGMSYGFPDNFSYWQFGRDWEYYRTIYEYHGGGIPYEQVWNFETPKAFLVETNPFALNVLVIAHVYGHVDSFLASHYLQAGRAASDIASSARSAADRFRFYEQKYGIEEYENTLDAADSLKTHLPLDIFTNEDVPEDEIREQLLANEHAKLKRNAVNKTPKKELTKEEIKQGEKKLRWLARKTPPVPMYDVLLYILRHSEVLRFEPWKADVVSEIRDQQRHLTPQMKTKMGNEGWATYIHVHIMRRLFKEGLLNDKEHDVFNYYHSRVLAENKYSLNWYRIGYGLFEHIKERWDKGRFGKEYNECTDPHKKSYWDIHAGLGNKKIFEVRASYSDRMLVENFFTDDFIHEQKIYIYNTRIEQLTG